MLPKNFNWYSFTLYRYKFYDVVWRVAATGVIGASVFIGAQLITNWNHSVHRTWQHYARKERERAELMEIIRQAREDGSLAASKVYGFQ
mmetsp:Transcript_16821/g.36947  ORF Transcript_16821/g.36947 Transcript_16821/m.36947 type:complete len:89 (-) Transcript_16821:108-374(-)